MDTPTPEIKNAQTQSPILPDDLKNRLVERLFLRMTALYGNKFADMWRGIDDAEVKKCWGDELAKFSVPAITFAVNELTHRKFVPTLPEFLEMCEAFKPRVVSMAHLPAPKYEKRGAETESDRLARERCMATMKTFSIGSGNPHAWAHKLADKAKAGERLSVGQMAKLKAFEVNTGERLFEDRPCE